ncbi:MAG TPA: bifunctional oligoribonuclease/PAP phosphatase NrnA [Candidatus Saccharimonadales bacterium]|nr:bifunctional oligoribonuclease/PAP phosphatase NrnA [Candidatus Saccharimonadales bacterium]
MELSPKAQAVELIRNSNQILILGHSDPDGDSVGSSLAMKLALDKLGKQSEVVLMGSLPENCAFLPGFANIKQGLSASNDLVITIDTRNTGEELRLGHKKIAETHQVVIVVSPPKGSLLTDDVTITRSRPKYDLVIILDCATLERLGDLPQTQPDLFFETPTVSLDHHASNSYFAKVNWVDMTATSTSEMLVSLFEALGKGENLLDEDIATALLTGLITDTGSFQNQSTTPKSLTVAAQLVAAGARQQEIIDKIFRTKPLSTLKLWGKILSRIEENTELSFAWSAVTAEDITSVGAKPTDTSGLIDELLKTAEGMKFVFLLSERDGQIHGTLRAVDSATQVLKLAKLFEGGGHQNAAAFSVEGTLEQKQEEIVKKISAAVAEGPTLMDLNH